MSIVSKNPATGKMIQEFQPMGKQQLEGALAKAQKAYELWKAASCADRARPVRRLAEILKNRAAEFGKIMAEEMGKPITGATAEAEKCAWVCEYYAQNAERMLQQEVVLSDASESFVRFDPLGPILAVMPWNFPFWQVIRFAAPALMAGNVGLLKHASNVPRCALTLEKIFLEAGFPDGVFQSLLIGADEVEGVINDPRVMAVTLTGSEAAGRKVAEAAGRNIKKTVLELGGNDPFIILEDAILPQACEAGVSSRLQNAGQSCIAAKRFIVVAPVAEKFLVLFKEKFESMRVGDPLNAATQMGPLATEDILKDLEKQVETSVANGAKVLTGGNRLERDGYFYAPTILSGVRKGMPAYHEELFGPVASVMVVQDEAEAVRVANDTKFGLGCSIWTQSTERAKKIAARIEAGCIFINGMVKSDPRLPFGGIKASGYGRELSHYGLKEFVNIKTVWVK